MVFIQLTFGMQRQNVTFNKPERHSKFHSIYSQRAVEADFNNLNFAYYIRPVERKFLRL